MTAIETGARLELFPATRPAPAADPTTPAGLAAPPAPAPPAGAGGPHTTTPIVLGVDLSLTSPGVAHNRLGVARLKPPRGLTGVQRLRWILAAVGSYSYGVDLIVVEGPAHSRALQQGHHELAGLWWMSYDYWDERGYPIAVVPPSTLKKYATGKGNSSKDQVLAAVIRRYPTADITGNDVADAYTLMAMGLDHLGHPLAAMPALNRAALDAVTWPELVIA